MTCIIGVELGDRCLVGSDSGVWAGSDYQALHTSCHKLARLRKGVLVGYAGHVSAGQRAVRALRGVKEFTPDAIAEALLELGEDPPKVLEDDAASLLIAVDGALYYADTSGVVTRSKDGVAGVGSYGYAVGFLAGVGWMSDDPMWVGKRDPKFLRTALQLALKCQAAHSSNAVPPFIVRST